MKSEFSRVNLLPNYVFAEINQLKTKLRKKGNDIIDFGMGNPDMPTPKHIRDKLKEVVDKPGVGRYSVSKGILGLRKAQANYYEKRFGDKKKVSTFADPFRMRNGNSKRKTSSLIKM